MKIRSCRAAVLGLALLLPSLFAPGYLAAQNRIGAGADSYYERGREAMIAEDWYAAAECFLEALRLSAAHAESTAALAECYYELGEFDQALTWVRKARTLARGSTALSNLEAFTLIALGQLESAGTLINAALEKEPYNKEALFAAAELDIARGRAGDALIRYREAVRRYPDDRRLLVSLALVLGSLGDNPGARSYIERALIQHSGDYRVYYYAAYLDAQDNRFSSAISYAERALYYRPGYAPARSLLASLRYRSGQYEEAARLADEGLAVNREDSGSWYLKGMAYRMMGREADAMAVLSTAVSVNPDDEFIRSALEDLLLSTTRAEAPERARWAAWHFTRAKDFRRRNLMDQALFEYRRGIRLNPYAVDRRDYAELLRLQGYPARYLEELRFMQEGDIASRLDAKSRLAVSDAVEAYDALLAGALYRRWGVDPVEVAKRHWKVAVFTVGAQSSFRHVDAGAVGAAYIKDLLAHDRNVQTMNIPLQQTSFSQAFRAARERGADYFLLVTISEAERDLSIKGDLFVGRTGSPAGSFSAYRTGADRLRNASRGLADQLAKALPFRGELLDRRASQALIDKGRVDGVVKDTVYQVIKKDKSAVLNEGIGLTYGQDDVVGSLRIEDPGEEVSAGLLTRNGFFDRIEAGDEIIFVPEKTEEETGSPAAASPAVETAANPELRNLLRTLR